MSRPRRTLLLVGLVIVLAVAAVGLAQSLKRSAGLCVSGETNYFSCKTAGGKWIAVCGSEDQVVQYRYGSVKNVELRYPRAPQETPLRFAHYARAQVERVEVSFEALGARYSVFDYSEEERHDAGVRVTKADGREVTIGCAGKVESRLFELEPRLECDADNALNLDGCARSAQ